jgi:Tol biopolymer transport system component
MYLPNERAPKSAPEMRQLTRIGGVRPFGCSVSRDGKRIAFASDAYEEGNVDIWVQDIEHNQPRRVTQAAEADLDPSISPDGTKVLFVSRRVSGPGIYEAVISGGQERLLIPGGEEPRYSPDGRQIAYLQGSDQRHLYISDSHGANAHEITTGLARLGRATWSPDGNYLMLRGQRNPGDPADWWVVRTSRAEVIETHILRDLAPYISSSLREFFYAQAWRPERSILFAADQDGIWSIWQIRLSPNFHLAGPPMRITGRTPIAVQFTAAANLVAFVNTRPDSQLWRLPIDAESGRLNGNPRRITRRGLCQFPSLSMDGTILAFYSSQTETRGGGSGIHVRNVNTGDEAIVGSSSEQTGYITLSRDGSKIAYGAIMPSRKRPIHIYDRMSGATRTLCDDCEGRPYDWSPNGTKLIVSMPERRVGLLDANTGQRSAIWPGVSAVFSADGRWLAVVGADESRRILIMRYRGGEKPLVEEWTSAGDPDGVGVLAGWSPSGQLLYFLSASRMDPPNYALKAQRFHPDSGRLEGESFLVYRFEEPFVPLATLPLNNRLAISAGQIILASAAYVGDIWTTQPDVNHNSK